MPSLRTLGGIELSGGASGELTPRRQELVLLVYLARRGPRPTSRQTLAALLWGDRDEARARHSLRQALSELRAELGDSLEITNETVRLHPSLELDVSGFEQAVDAGQWEKATALWQGEFLGECDELGTEDLRAWIEQERAGLRKKLAWAYRMLVQQSHTAGGPSVAITHAERWCEALPYDEAAIQASINALRIGGRSAEAEARLASSLARLKAAGIVPSSGLLRLAATPSKERVPTGAHGVQRPDMVGRADALRQLESGWQTVIQGVGKAVLILGNDGMGKSRLCREFAQHVRSRAARVTVVGNRAFEAEREQLWSALRPVLASLAKAPGLPATPAAALASAAMIAPEIRERFPILQLEGLDLEPPASAVTRIVTEIAAEQPLLLLLDDVCASDSASLEVLAGLVRRPPPSCLIVLADRAASLLASPLASDLRQASPELLRIDLDPLGVEDIALMVSSMMPLAVDCAPPLARRLFEVSSGNPATIEALIACWVEEGVLAPGPDGRWAPVRPLDESWPVPAGIRESTARILARLSADGQAVLEAASLIGPDISPDSLAYLSGVLPQRVAAALGELLSHRLLVESPRHAGQYEFTGELERRVVAEGLGPARRRELDRRSSSAASRRRMVRRRRLPVALGLVLLLVLAWWMTRPGAAAVLPGSQVLLADVSNATADPGLGPAFYSAVTVGLQGSRYLSLFPRSRVRETLARMGKQNADSVLTEQLALEIASREGVPIVVAFGITQADTTFVLSVRLLDPVSGRPLDGASVTVASRGDLLTGMDRLLSRTLKALSGSREGRNGATEPLPQVTTSSIDALRAYAAGMNAWTRRDKEAAKFHWERAVALDTAFALAHAALADVWYVGYNDRAAGDRWMNRALSQLDRLTEREQLRLKAQAAQRRGQGAQAEDFSRLLAERYPSRDTWYNHGTTLMGEYRCREAIPSFQKALEFDSSFTNGYLNLATCLQLAGPIDSAIAAYRAAGQTDSTTLYRGNINHEWGVALVRAGRPEAAESAYRRMAAAASPGDRARGFRSLAWLDMHRGQFRAAVGHLRQAIELSRSQQEISVFRNEVILAQALFALGERTAGLRVLDSATARIRRVPPVPGLMLYLGMAQLRAGRLDAARKTLQSLNAGVALSSSYDRAVRQGLESHVLLAGGDPLAALAAAEPFHDERQAAFRLSALALGYAKIERFDSALAVAARLSNTFAFGEESQLEWQGAPLLVARIAEAMGDSATARSAYSGFIERWEHGDSDLPDLQTARRNLERLQPRR